MKGKKKKSFKAARRTKILFYFQQKSFLNGISQLRASCFCAREILFQGVNGFIVRLCSHSLRIFKCLRIRFTSLFFTETKPEEEKKT